MNDLGRSNEAQVTGLLNKINMSSGARLGVPLTAQHVCPLLVGYMQSSRDEGNQKAKTDSGGGGESGLSINSLDTSLCTLC